MLQSITAYNLRSHSPSSIGLCTKLVSGEVLTKLLSDRMAYVASNPMSFIHGMDIPSKHSAVALKSSIPPFDYRLTRE